jgi:hypothetical protein
VVTIVRGILRQLSRAPAATGLPAFIDISATGPFTDAGLRLRNESRAIGCTTLQDLLAEEVTRIVTGIMRLAVQRRSPQAWSFVADVLGDLLGTDYEDAPARRGRAESSDHRSRPVS